MIIRHLKWPLLFIACFILQTSFIPSIAIFGVKPDLLMLVLFFFAIRYGIMPGIFVGFLVGLTQDLYTPSILGQQALAKTIIGACSGMVNEKVMRTDPIAKTVLLFFLFIVHDALFFVALISRDVSSVSEIVPFLFLKTVPRALYSVLIAMLFYAWEFFPKQSSRR
jgi:rod shape-determining protein MreD